MCVLFNCWALFNAFYCQLLPRSLKINYYINIWILLVHCITLICAITLSRGLPDVCSAWFFVTSATYFSHSWVCDRSSVYRTSRAHAVATLGVLGIFYCSCCPGVRFIPLHGSVKACLVCVAGKCVLSSAGMGDVCEKVLAVLLSLLRDASCVGKNFTVVFRIAWKYCCQNCQKIGSEFYLTIKANNKIFTQVNKFKKAFLKLLCFGK